MDLEELCRVCLCIGRTMCSLLEESIRPKFDSPPNSVIELWKIFNKMLIVNEDRRPVKICKECLDEIQRMYTFLFKCERSEDVFQKIKPAAIYLKKLKIVSDLNDQNILKKIKLEKDVLPNILRNQTKNITWNGIDEKDSNWNPIEEIICRNVGREIDSPLHHTLINQLVEVSLGIELLDHEDGENYVRNDEVSVIQHIKREPELDICLKNYEFNEIESEYSSEIVKCPGCHYECRINENVEQHMIVHHMDGQICKLCNKEFQGRPLEHCSKHLRVNSRNVTLKSTKIRQNNRKVCAKKSKWESTLSQHIIFHSRETPFKCELCSRTFRQKNTIRDHLLVHKGIKPFECQICAKSFTRKSDLKSHLTCHTREKIFKCEFCPKAFIQKRYLTYHLKLHMQEKLFKCEICRQKFIDKIALTSHFKCHMKERRFKCTICFKDFPRNADLLRHIRWHTGDSPFKCKFCLRTFARNDYLRSHLTGHMRELQEGKNYLKTSHAI